MIRMIRNRGGVLAALIIAAAFTGQARAALVGLGGADDFVLLALNNGTMTINSSTSIIGNVGYSSGVTSNTNQKVDLFTGTAYVHSNVASFNYAAATFQPSGGIVTSATGDAKLNQANVDALAAAAAYAGAAATQTLNPLTNKAANPTYMINGNGSMNVIKILADGSNQSVDMDANDTLQINGVAGEQFIIDVVGDFDFSAATIKLVGGVTANDIVFNMLSTVGHVVVNKQESVFLGTILAANTGTSVTYHNPASFTGRIIGYDIDVHSDFNIEAPPIRMQQVPLPASFASGLVLVVGSLLRRPRRLVK